METLNSRKVENPLMRPMTLRRTGPLTRPTSAFTLAEVVISIAIVAIIFGGVIGGYISSTRRAEWSGFSLAAQALAIQQLEQARSAVWDLSIGKNELTNLNLTAWTYNSGAKTWKGYSSSILDLPISGNTNNAPRATNFVTVTMINVNGTTIPPVQVQMVQVDTVWVFYSFGGKRLYTNTIASYFAADNRDASSL